MRTPRFPIVAAAVAAGFLIPAALQASHLPSGDHVMLQPAEFQWKDAPSVGPGVQMSIVEGDLKRPEPFVFRLRLPPGTVLPVHTHPVTERVTVISGTLYLGLGDTLDRSRARALSEGSIAIMEPGVKMYAFTKEETIIQLNGVGPWGITYFDPHKDAGADRAVGGY
jgi:quercetin dioxygenase-like cupin family protein